MMLLPESWFRKILGQGIISENPNSFNATPGGIPIAPAAASSPGNEPNTEKKKIDWGSIIKEALPYVAIAAYGTSDPIAASSAMDRWQQIQEQKRLQKMQEDELNFKKQQLEQDLLTDYNPSQYTQKLSKDNPWIPYLNNPANFKTRKELMEAYQQAATWEQNKANIAARRELEAANVKPNQPTEEQIQLAKQISAQAGKYRSKNDYLADLRRYREQIENQIGPDLYNKLFAEANQLTDNIWPGGKTAGAQFVPGQSSPLRTMLGIQQTPKAIVARKPTGVQKPTNQSVKSIQLKNKKTGEIVTAYIGLKDGQYYSTEAEARAH